MKREFLEGLGIEKELIDQIMAEHGKGVEQNKSKAEQLAEAQTKLTEQLAERDKQLKELQKVDVGALQEEIKKLTETNTASSAKFASEMQAFKKNAALKLALQSITHDPQDVISLLDQEKIELDENGSLKGDVNELVKDIKEQKSYLFKETNPTALKTPKLGDPKPGTGSADLEAWRAEAGL